MIRYFGFFLILLCLTLSSACSTQTPVDDDQAESGKPVVEVVPGDGCPEVEPDLTSITGAKLDEGRLHIAVRTTTWCNQHTFSVHRCDEADRSATYRVSESNDCAVPNDGVIEHILVLETDSFGGAVEVERFDAQTVTVTRL